MAGRAKTRASQSKRLAGWRSCAQAVILAISLAVMMPHSAGLAQDVRYHNPAKTRALHAGAKPIRRSFASDSEARAILRRLLAAAGLAGLEDRIVLRATDETTSALAQIENGERQILYNADFMQQLKERTQNYWSLIAVLAHEVSHHVRFHTEVMGRDHEFELEADRQAGFILRRMGATRQEAVALFRTFSAEATPTHPGRAARVQAVTLGWIDGGSPGGKLQSGASREPVPAANVDISKAVGARPMRRFVVPGASNISVSPVLIGDNGEDISAGKPMAFLLDGDPRTSLTLRYPEQSGTIEFRLPRDRTLSLVSVEYHHPATLSTNQFHTGIEVVAIDRRGDTAATGVRQLERDLGWQRVVVSAGGVARVQVKLSGRRRAVAYIGDLRFTFKEVEN